MEDSDICDSWEQIEENSRMVEQQFEKLRLKAIEDGGSTYMNGEKNNSERCPSQRQDGSSRVELDSTSSESLRTQYAPSQPKPFSILSRPKTADLRTAKVNGIVKNLKNPPAPVKSLQQREQEYAEARKRILGDVRFLEEEREAELEASMSPAEILKMKISEVMCSEISDFSEESSGSKCRENITRGMEKSSETLRPENIRKDFPVSKLESDHIVRQPRGPDGTVGFRRNESL